MEKVSVDLILKDEWKLDRNSGKKTFQALEQHRKAGEPWACAVKLTEEQPGAIRNCTLFINHWADSRQHCEGQISTTDP